MDRPLPPDRMPVSVLNDATLRSIRGTVAVPSYDRRRVRTGMVHIGVGGFHRAHQAMYADRLMNAGLALDWGICGVGVLPSDWRMRDALTAQDGLYTLVVKHPDGSLEPRVIGSIVEYLLAPDDPEAVVEKMTHVDTRIVSLTITERGYRTDEARNLSLGGLEQCLDKMAAMFPPRTDG